MRHAYELIEATGETFSTPPLPHSTNRIRSVIYKRAVCSLCGAEGKGESPFVGADPPTGSLLGYAKVGEDSRAIWRFGDHLSAEWIGNEECEHGTRLEEAIRNLMISRYEELNVSRYRSAMAALLEADRACPGGFLNRLGSLASALQAQV